MEFRFDLNEIFQHPIAEVGNSLIPPAFSGDKRALWDVQSKITQIVNAMGEASAHAQGLSKPITTADRLRNSEHRLYLLMDQTANNGKGAVTGMLKTGEKGLYVFDREGQHYQVSPPCVLDFYIHESRQRSGFGKRLFEHMLQKEQIEPVRMAIDRPSDKFLGFLNKHYSLHSPVKQMNNYVVFDGFFPRTAETARTVEADKSFTPTKKQSANGLQQSFAASPYGRYGAPRPTCSMGQIIHNDSPVIKRNQEPAGVRSEPATNVQGQANAYYGNQPAWQFTQSVPNMHYAQNPQNYTQNQMPSYVPNQQSPQNQPIMPNYRASSGDFQNMAQPVSQNQGAVQFNQSLDQGDAASQINRQPGMLRSAQEQQNMQNVQQMPQNSPNYYWNSQNQQYQLNPNSPYAQQYYQQREVTRQPGRTKELLIPQNLDGTPKKSLHMAQSMPMQGAKEHSTVVLQNSASAPINLQQQAAINNYPQLNTYNGHPVQQVTNTNAIAPQNPIDIAQSSPNQQGPMNYHQQAYTVASVPQMTVQNPPVQQHIANQNEEANQMNERMSQMNILQNTNMTPHVHSQPGAQLNNQAFGEMNALAQMANPLQAGDSVPAQPYIPNPSNNLNANNQLGMPNEQYQNVQQVQSTLPLVGNSSMAQNLTAHQYSVGDQMQQSTQQHQQQNVEVPQQPVYVNQPEMGRFAPNVTRESQLVPQHQQQNVDVPRQPVYVNQPEMGRFAPNVRESQLVPQHQQQNVDVPQQPVYVNQPEMGRFAPNVTRESHSVPGVNVGNIPMQEIRQGHQLPEIDLSKGYPPQHHENSAQNSTPRADRPNSLNIEPAEEVEPKTINDTAEAETNEEALDGEHENANSLDGDAIDAIEREIQRIEIAPNNGTPQRRGSKSPGIEAAGIVTPGRSTPGLTDQGYFDLKFYHNKLW